MHSPIQKPKAPTGKRAVLCFLAAHLLLLLCALLFPLFWQTMTGTIPGKLLGRCLMHDLLHVYRPACGMTRALSALLSLDLVRSFLYHPLIPLLALLFLYCDARTLVTLCREKVLRVYWRAAFGWGILTVFLLCFVLRNFLLIAFGFDTIGDLLPYYR